MNPVEQWLVGDLRYKLHAAQLIIYDKLKDLPPNVREVLIFCSRRFGKSYLGAVRAIEDALETPNRQIAVIGPTKKQTLEIVAPLIRMVAADAPEGAIKQTKSEYKWTLYNGSTIQIGGFDLAIEDFRGKFFHNIYLEESGLANENEFEYIIRSVLLPTLLHSRGRIFHLTTPAKTIEHPLHTVTLPKTQKDGSFFTFDVHSNPLVTPEEIAEIIEEMGGPDSADVQRELFCKIIKDDNIVVVPYFSLEKHVKSVEPSAEANYWVSGDVGGVRDKTVLHLWCFDPEIDKLLVLSEFVADKQTPTPLIIEGGRKMEGDREDLYRAVDAPGQLLIDFASLGYPCILPEKLKFDQNIQRIQTAFYHDEILVNPACTFTISSLANGQLNKQRTDFARSVALGHCDAIASIVYGLRHADRTKPKRKINRQEIFTSKPDTDTGAELAKLSWGKTWSKR